MKKFVLYCAAFFTGICLLLVIVEFIYRRDKEDYKKEVCSSDVYFSITKSKKKQKVKKIILGDSVANQLYMASSYNDSIYSLTCNQAVSVAGHYFLLRNFLQTNRNQLPEEIFLIYNPFSFCNNLDEYAFNYFLKPFYNSEYEGLMDDYLFERIKQIPYYYLSRSAFIKTSDFSPEYQPDYDDYGLFSPISKIYLGKMVELCRENGISFQLEPAPVKESRRTELENLENGFSLDTDSNMLKAYVDNFVFYNDSLFIDNLHFRRECIPADYLKLNQQQ